MALIKCPECGREISDKAGTCPNCGHPISSQNKQKKSLKRGDIILLIVFIAGCVSIAFGVLYAIYGNKDTTPSGASKTEKVIAKENSNVDSKTNSNNTNIQNEYSIDGITISANNFKVEPYDDQNGKYTKRILVDFTIKNETDKAFGYSTSWQGKLSDGYKLEPWINISDMDLIQVASNSEKTDTAYLLADDSVKLDKIIATYNFMDYDEDYWDDFGKIMKGEMGEDEYIAKYGEPEELIFELTPLQ